MAKPILHLDFETYCELDLRRVGIENYLRHSSFCVTVMAWAFDDEDVQSIVWPATRTLPTEIIAHIERDGEIRAWNSAFEFELLKEHYNEPVGVEQMNCVMQRALSYGLPSGLLKAGRALRLKVLKDETKRLLMLQMGRPRKGAAPWHETDPVKLAYLRAYCEDDVRAERAVDEVVPALHPWEKKLSELDHRINRKGVMIDRVAVAALRMAADTVLADIDAECARLTGGAVTKPGSQTQKLMAWLAENRCPLADVSKETIDKALSDPHLPVAHPTVKRVLELRQQAAKSSVAKLDRMMQVASDKDDRARHLLQFAGAGRTLRWAGRLIQPQNLPRTLGQKSEQLIATVTQEPGALSLLWGSGAMDGISRALRSCFVAQRGHVLVAVDLAQIEARVLAWIAGQGDVIDAFRRSEDVYVLAARKVGSDNRQLGKVLTLACGYGMGWQKFKDTAGAAPYNVELSDTDAKNHLRTWRDKNGAITGLWGEVERGFRHAIAHPGYVFHLPRLMAVRTDRRSGVTQLRKPNGVRLTYHNMRLWDGELIFDGVNSTTKAWGIEKAYGGRLVENMVQSIARDVMAENMLISGEVPVMTVHDEIVWEVPEVAPMIFVMHPPAWADDLPVASDMSVGWRYSK